MTSLINNPFTQVIIFHDGSKKFITEDQAVEIMRASGSQLKSITTPKLGMISFSSIAKIITLKDFYDQYPDQMPETKPELKVEEVKPMSLDEQAKHSQTVRNGLIQGLEREIAIAEARGDSQIAAREILERFKKGKASEHNNSNYWVKVVEKYKNKNRNESEESHYQFALKKCKNNLFV